MAIKKDLSVTGHQHGPTLMAAGGILAALASSSCCVVPLVLFTLGVSGAWIGTLTRLAPYQPYFIAATIAFLGGGYWLVYRSSRMACAEGEACARPLPQHLAKSALVAATVLVVIVIAFDIAAPLLLSP